MLTMLKDGGVCSPKGFTACGWTAGIKASGNPDMALLKSEKAARCFAVFTTNKVKAAPVLYDKSVLEHAHFASAVIVNSGNANACTEECSGLQYGRHRAPDAYGQSGSGDSAFGRGAAR